MAFQTGRCSVKKGKMMGMKESFKEKMKTRLERISHSKYSKKVGAAVAIAGLAITTFVLMQPASTQQQQPSCGIEEHTHTGNCYASILECDPLEDVHVHNVSCYDDEHNLVCGKADFILHTHDINCYNEKEQKICTLEQIESHEHDDSCYGTKTTTIEHHHHDESCYETQSKLTCTNEQEDHTHDETCYSSEQVLTCDQEEQEDEIITEKVLTCDKEVLVEHTHDASCYNDEHELVCGLLQVTSHQHDESCLSFEQDEAHLVCNQTEHVHNDSCYLNSESQSQQASQEDEPNEEQEDQNQQIEHPEDSSVQEEQEETAAQTQIKEDETSKDEQEEIVELDEQNTKNVEVLWMNDSGMEVEAFADDQPFEIEATFEIEADAAASEIVLDDSLQAEEISISSGYSAILNESEQTITIIQEDEDEEQVDLQIKGTIKRSARAKSASLLGQSIPLLVSTYLEDGWFVYKDATLTAKMQLDVNNPIDNDVYELCVEYEDGDSYQNALSNFEQNAGGLSVQEIKAMRIYLQNKQTKEKYSNYGQVYLDLSFEDGLFSDMQKNDKILFGFSENDNTNSFNQPKSDYDANGNLINVYLDRTWQNFNTGTFVFVQYTARNGIQTQNLSVSFNEVRDAFLDSIYYNTNSPIGTCGSFHLVAFDTLYLNAHCNGNVLANNLVASANFGTNNYGNELSYIKNYQGINSTSAANRNSLLVLGSDNTWEVTDNGNALEINSTKVSSPTNFIFDQDTSQNPYIDLERTEQEIYQICANLAGMATTLDISNPNGNRATLQLASPDDVGVYNVAAENLSVFTNDMDLKGFESGHDGTIIINVDCSNVSSITMPERSLIYRDNQVVNTNEVTEFSAGKVIWNFINAQDKTITLKNMTGIVLAPGANVYATQNINGTIVADNITTSAETHRTDFTGRIEQGQSSGITIKKHETGFLGSALSGAKFSLSVYENNKWKDLSMSIATDETGEFFLDFAKNSLQLLKAYRLTETKAPAGYSLNEEPIDFYVSANTYSASPNEKPDDFDGIQITLGSLLYIGNDEKPDEPDEIDLDSDLYINIDIQKLWQDATGALLENPAADEIEVCIFQLRGDQTEGKNFDHVIAMSEFDGAYSDDEQKPELSVYKKAVLGEANNWQASFENMDGTDLDETDNVVDLIYVVDEISQISGYTSSISKEINEEQDGLVTAKITVTNTQNVYDLPATGASSKNNVLLAGTVLAAAGLTLISIRIKTKRKES
jgi:choice-of-anchor A domain-containing protein/LPXTG-motif cell wall-anchored protein